MLDQTESHALLHLRGDIYCWSLPGGGVEPDETWEAAAIREVVEETGYRVAIERRVGDYARPQIGDTKRVFVGRVVGGAPRTCPPETVAVAWFPVDRLPLNRLPWTQDYVGDAVASSREPVYRVQHQTPVTRWVMWLLYAIAGPRAWLGRRRRAGG